MPMYNAKHYCSLLRELNLIVITTSSAIAPPLHHLDDKGRIVKVNKMQTECPLRTTQHRRSSPHYARSVVEDNDEDALTRE